mmetsp:Transcript_6567/g.21543  ORF Transcript_6567/g.21543 Transcript_6567/m.21543 type:complete len:286 (-) Transcript_6567:107-964(-)
MPAEDQRVLLGHGVQRRGDRQRKGAHLGGVHVGAALVRLVPDEQKDGEEAAGQDEDPGEDIPALELLPRYRAHVVVTVAAMRVGALHAVHAVHRRVHVDVCAGRAARHQLLDRLFERHLVDVAIHGGVAARLLEGTALVRLALRAVVAVLFVGLFLHISQPILLHLHLVAEAARHAHRRAPVHALDRLCVLFRVGVEVRQVEVWHVHVRHAAADVGRRHEDTMVRRRRRVRVGLHVRIGPRDGLLLLLPPPAATLGRRRTPSGALLLRRRRVARVDRRGSISNFL